MGLWGAISGALGAVPIVGGIVRGIGQNNKANDIEKNNARPTYQIPDEYNQNLAIANHMAQTGIPQQQYQNQLNAINRNQAAGVQALGRSQNPTGSIASIVRAGNDAANQLNAQDAMAQQNNQRFAMGQRGMLGQQRLAQQQYNKFDKYTENFNQAAALRGAANQNFNNASNGIFQLGAAGISSGLFGGGDKSLTQPTMAGSQTPNFLQRNGYNGTFGATQYNNPYLPSQNQSMY